MGRIVPVTEEERAEDKPLSYKERLKQEASARIQACYAALQEVLDQHNCKLIATPAFTPDGRVIAHVGIEAE